MSDSSTHSPPCPPNARILFRLPNWLGDVCMALPVVTAIQKKYPQAQFAFLAQPAYLDLLEKLGVEGEKLPLPAKNWRYFFHFLMQRRRFDAQILFTNSERGDLEAWLMRSRQRYGIARPNKGRKLLTQRYTLSGDFDEESYHQTQLWGDFTASFGWHNGLDLTAFQPVEDNASGNASSNVADSTADSVADSVADKAAGAKIGLICGSANTPEKRWPAEYWQALIDELLAREVAQIVLLGTADDAAVCEHIAANAGDARVENRAGKTQLPQLVDTMRGLDCVIGNDTGGLHLANAVGVAVIGLYGHTNPVRCRPIFDAPLTILRPEPPADGSPAGMADIAVAQVVTAVETLLPNDSRAKKISPQGASSQTVQSLRQDDATP
ncbi:MAG: hypothetical protein CR974_03225 [Gammaproteobacteria bacterium]|nr:MAG: hypothetical protein CR974_03225 [Gammaproteobacteria bacterium]